MSVSRLPAALLAVPLSTHLRALTIHSVFNSSVAVPPPDAETLMPIGLVLVALSLMLRRRRS